MLFNSPVKHTYFSKKKYFYHYIRSYECLSLNFCYIRPVHYVAAALSTRWPFYISICLALSISYFLVSLQVSDLLHTACLITLLGVLYYAFCWFSDMIIDSTILGMYNKKIRQSISYGFMLFLFSEIFCFISFFWGYFDRLFDPSVYAGGSTLPYGLEPLFKNIKPLYGTAILILSGYFANWAAYFTHSGEWSLHIVFADLAILTGSLFLGIQVAEYLNLLFTLADSIYGSLFYLLTGFHGIHVIIGLLFLITQSHRMLHCHTNRDAFQGYRLALIYWHFVDYIWVFLFVSIYVINWNYQYYFSWNF